MPSLKKRLTHIPLCKGTLCWFASRQRQKLFMCDYAKKRLIGLCKRTFFLRPPWGGSIFIWMTTCCIFVLVLRLNHAIYAYDWPRKRLIVAVVVSRTDLGTNHGNKVIDIYFLTAGVFDSPITLAPNNFMTLVNWVVI